MTANPKFDAALPALPHRGQRRYNLGFLCPHNPFDRQAFSGTAFFAARALKHHPDIDLTILGPHRAPRITDRVFRRSPPAIDPQGLDLGGLDAVIGLVATDLLDRIAPRLDIPFLHVTDATPDFLRDVYGWDIPARADTAEARVVRHAAAVVYSSQEMATIGARTYGCHAAAVPFGINFDTTPEDCPEKPPTTCLDLLFVGNDWDRKGGEIALATLEELRATGCDAHLTVVGHLPDRHRSHPGITATGYLDKNRPGAAARLAGIYGRAHLMILPTRADCTPMVVGEAMAHGTPVLATNIGGMGTLLGRDAGQLMSPTADRQAWARAVRQMTEDPARYGSMRRAAFQRARTRLNWPAWAEGIATILDHQHGADEQAASAA